MSREVEEREFANDYEKARLEAVERLKAEEERKYEKEKERVEALKQQMIVCLLDVFVKNEDW